MNTNLTLILSEEFKYSLQFLNEDVSKDLPFTKVTSEIFIYSTLMNKDSMAYMSLLTIVDSDVIKNISDEIIKTIPSSTLVSAVKPGIDIPFSEGFLQDLEQSSLEIGFELISSDHFLLGVLSDKTKNITRIFEEFGIDYEILKKQVYNLHYKLFNNQYSYNHDNVNYVKKNSGIIKPYEFIRNKDYINNIIILLSKKDSSIVTIVGDTGSGKTLLLNNVIYKLDNSMYEFIDFYDELLLEDYSINNNVYYNLISKMKDNNHIKYVFVIDDIDFYLSNADGTKDIDLILNLLNINNSHIMCCLNSNSINIIDDKLLRFKSYMSIIKIEDISIEETNHIIENRKSEYEAFHNVYFDENSLKNISYLCYRYINSDKLPSSAIKVMDESAAYCKIEGRKYVTEDDVRNIISRKTDIPLQKITDNMAASIKDLYTKLKSFIIGQDNACKIISDALKLYSVGLSQRNKPILTSILIGPSGCGKTFMAKVLAKEILGDESYLIRFDMSEFSDKTSVNKLIGSSSGYIGYENGGLLTEAVKNKRYAVLLLDEIEKADESVFNLMLQIMDEGFLTDNKGYHVDFRNVILIMTSNIGVKRSVEQNYSGFICDEGRISYSKSIMEKEFKNKFSPEFINRIDEVIYFNHLDEDSIRNIVDIKLNDIINRASKNGSIIRYDRDVNDFIFNKSIEVINYGARPIDRIIREHIEIPLCEYFLDNIGKSDNCKISIVNNKVLIKKVEYDR